MNNLSNQSQFINWNNDNWNQQIENKIFEMKSMSEGNEKHLNMKKFAAELAVHHQFDKVLELFNQQSSSVRDHALWYVGEKLLEKGDVLSAIELANRLPGPKGHAFYTIDKKIKEMGASEDLTPELVKIKEAYDAALKLYYQQHPKRSV